MRSAGEPCEVLQPGQRFSDAAGAGCGRGLPAAAAVADLRRLSPRALREAACRVSSALGRGRAAAVAVAAGRAGAVADAGPADGGRLGAAERLLLHPDQW